MDVRRSPVAALAGSRCALRIVEIVSGRGVNGAVKHCLALTRELTRRAHQLTLVCRPDSWIAAQLTADPVDVELSDLHRWPIDELRRVSRLLGERQVDVIHTHMSRAHFFGVLLKAFTRVPVVATAHSRWLQGHWMFNDHVIAVSHAVAKFHRWNLVSARRIVVIHQFVDVDEFVPLDEACRHHVRASLDIGGSTPLVGIVGSVFREKGPQDLIAAWSTVVAAVPGAHLAIIGDGPDEFTRELRRAVDAARLQQHVSWLGQRNDVPRLVGALDVLAMPSHEEAAPLAALEAMAAGIPVVATNVGGVAEYVRDGETGILVRRGDIRGLADAIVRLLTDEPARRRYGTAGRERLVERFSLAVQVPKIEAVLDRVRRVRGVRL